MTEAKENNVDTLTEADLARVRESLLAYPHLSKGVGTVEEPCTQAWNSSDAA